MAEISPRVEIDVWSDIACPWCFVGKRHLEQALRTFESPENVRVRWHAFELDPSAPARVEPGSGYVHRLAEKYSVSVDQAEDMIARMVHVGQDRGIRFEFAHVVGTNTFRAHRLMELARRVDTDRHQASLPLQNALAERLFDAYFCRGAWLGDSNQLLAEAAAVGLDVDNASGWLGGDDGAEEVRGDQLVAARLGVTGVPFFKIGRYGVAGAQPPEVLGDVIVKVWNELRTDSERVPAPKAG